MEVGNEGTASYLCRVWPYPPPDGEGVPALRERRRRLHKGFQVKPLWKVALEPLPVRIGMRVFWTRPALVWAIFRTYLRSINPTK